jgi:undecaprenyl phosphate-alpha-L-ara4N flippase subunit ArnE
MIATQWLVITGAILAAAGQIFLKLGATGAQTFTDYLNGKLVVGFGLYGFSAVLWLLALNRLPLSRVYPYTALTFLIVYVASFTVLGEPITANVIIGALLVMAGLVLVTLP